jgi:tripeptide aminopeptidase
MLADWGIDSLTTLVSKDSHSDERSNTIPSTEGQRKLCEFLAAFFDRQGLEIEMDDHANLIVKLPENPPGNRAPSIALLTHMDTCRGTEAVRELTTTPAWEGTAIDYPGTDRILVTVDEYPETEPFLRHDLVHGPGRAPIGLDNKLGIAELLTLARVLLTNPEIEHGEVLLIFRPDEEIGRMEAVTDLADRLVERGVAYGYTVDGIEPFEVNVENFNAARALVTITGDVAAEPAGSVRRLVEVKIAGVKSHGATAKAERYLNATVVFARAMQTLSGRADIRPVDFRSDPVSEVNATLTVELSGPDDSATDEAQGALLEALESELQPHSIRGAGFEVVGTSDATGASTTDEAQRLAAHLAQFLGGSAVEPILSEDSEGHEGYSNPCFVERTADDALTLHYRLRAFEPEQLEARVAHVRSVAEGADGGPLPVEVQQQYVNMGPALAAYPQLVEWAQDAAQAIGVQSSVLPIRGGTGVDPFIERGIPIANLGTGYFAAESEKEFTSRQMLTDHVVWLSHLVQVAAASGNVP